MSALNHNGDFERAPHRDWQPIETAPEHEEVWTKIHDDDGERNLAKLTRHARLWYTHPTNGMYVYYTPTHWQRA